MAQINLDPGSFPCILNSENGDTAHDEFHPENLHTSRRVAGLRLRYHLMSSAPTATDLSAAVPVSSSLAMLSERALR